MEEESALQRGIKNAPIRTRLFWYPNDDAPADRVHKNREMATAYAMSRSSEVRGKVELFCSDSAKIGPFETYVEGKMTIIDGRYTPEAVALM